ncbi:hypothetical protein SNEBB_007024 [Seison nebaliae]|nr:hypothetical protein SNEBB_007024 [Seison nebaliae]
MVSKPIIHTTDSQSRHTPLKAVENIQFASIKEISPSPSKTPASSSSPSQHTPQIPKFASNISNYKFAERSIEPNDQSDTHDPINNVNETTTVSIIQQICESSITVLNDSGPPTQESVALIQRKENPNKRPRTALYAPFPPLSIETQTPPPCTNRSTQTDDNNLITPSNLTEVQPPKSYVSSATQTDTSPHRITEATVLLDTEMQDVTADIIDITPNLVNNAPDHINITQVNEECTMKMARDYFGGKPFVGQQKIAAEKFPPPKELKKLAAEDMRKAAYFIFEHKKNEETKYCTEESLKKHGLPKLIFVMENADQTRAELRRLNGQYRKFVRKIHGLRHDFKIEGLHLKPINGGYGATDIEERIARGKYHSTSKMIDDQSSKSFSKIVAKSKIPKIRRENAKYLKITSPEDEEDLRSFHQNKLLKKLSQSKRVMDSAKPFFNNKRANKWITNDRIPHKFKTDFMKMRYNIMPTRSSTRFFNGGKTRCRGCGGQSESVKHLISKCAANKGLITARHNAVIDHLLKIGPRHATKIFKEKTFLTQDGMIKPDLILVSNNIARVFEVAVPFEDNESTLEKMYTEKLKKYSKHKSIIAESLQVGNVLFEPIILGAMGDVLDKSANSIVRNFKTSKFSISDLSQINSNPERFDEPYWAEMVPTNNQQTRTKEGASFNLTYHVNYSIRPNSSDRSFHINKISIGMKKMTRGTRMTSNI